MIVGKTVGFEEKELKELMKTAEEKELSFSEYMREMVTFYKKFPHEHIKKLKSAQGNPAWQKVLDDIKSQAIESNHMKVA